MVFNDHWKQKGQRTGCTIPLDKPDQKEFTYGSTVKRFTKTQSATSSVADKSYKMSRTTMNYVTSDDS